MASPFDKNSDAQTAILETVINDGFDGMNKAISMLINEAMLLERQRYLKAGHYQRSDERVSQSNGFEPRNIKSRMGELELNRPTTRDGQFYPQCLDKGLRSERALKLAVAEMYINGVSTRRVAKITEKLCGFDVTSSQVSKATKELDEEFEKWRNRPLGEMKYLYLDARYEKVRENKQVIDVAVLIAVGVDNDGNRSILGTSISNSEHEIHWREFLIGLQKRGLIGVTLIISDAHAGLKSARRTVFTNVPWQRCQFHLQQNAQAHIPRKSMNDEVSADIRKIITSASRAEAEERLEAIVKKYEQPAPQLASWMEDNLPESFGIYNFPENDWKKIRTSNLVERLNREVARRTNVVSIFPNKDSCLRLVTALLVEKNEDWQREKPYLRKK